MVFNYATPADVRPLLGNLASQRTDPQIQSAIDSAEKEINRVTNHAPPNTPWTSADPDWEIVKKLARHIAAKEMAIGIKDFDVSTIETEIERLYGLILKHGSSDDLIVISEPATYAASRTGLIWSLWYPNLRKDPSALDEGSINFFD